MAFRCLKLLRIVRSVSIFRHNLIGTSVALPDEVKIIKPKQFKTEDNLVYLEDPDNFGTLSRVSITQPEDVGDEDDVKEEKYLENVPLRSQKLTIKQYADLIKQYLQHKRLKEAIDVLEVRMLKEDRVKPVNYIYNILIGACAELGYTKKAFKLYNEMKRRALKPTGDTYTCLFNACALSPWPQYGLKNASHLRNIMIEKGVEPNLTNYNAMIKAFGWCGDLPTAFQLVDEMVEKKMKIRVHTFNHLLHACISDKTSGLRHALIVWRKMLMMKEKPNVYSFNLMLKCVKDCNLGSKEDIAEMIGTIESLMPLGMKNTRQLALEQSDSIVITRDENPSQQKFIESTDSLVKMNNDSINSNEKSDSLTIVDKKEDVKLEFVQLNKVAKVMPEIRSEPNLLSKLLNMEQVTALQDVHTVQDKFAMIGGQDDFLKEMQVYNVKPTVKTFTQMLALLDNSTEAEEKLLATIKASEINADIDFYNMLIKKRCLRSDYDAAMAVKQIIKKESEFRKKRYPHSKKLKLKVNIMTYGVLAMACKTRESAEQLLNEMDESKLRVNIAILGTLLRQGTANNNFGYVMYIMNTVKKENVQLNDIFLKHLENFNEKCLAFIKKEQESDTFKKCYENFSKYYTNWLKNVNIDEVLKSEHPWDQFKENYPKTVQRDSVVIKEPKKFYKRNRKYVPYTPRIVK